MEGGEISGGNGRGHRASQSPCPSELDSDSRALDKRSADYVATVLRAVTGPLPIVGPLFSELAGVVVPDQRVERIASFAVELDRRLSSLEAADSISDRLGNEHFADLLEEGIRQAVRSLSDDRRQYLAALVVNRLTTQDIEYSESRHLLRMLNELSDVEIIWLRFYLDRTWKFSERHESVLAPPRPPWLRLETNKTRRHVRRHCRTATRNTCVDLG